MAPWRLKGLWLGVIYSVEGIYLVLQNPALRQKHHLRIFLQLSVLSFMLMGIAQILVGLPIHLLRLFFWTLSPSFLHDHQTINATLTFYHSTLHDLIRSLPFVLLLFMRYIYPQPLDSLFMESLVFVDQRQQQGRQSSLQSPPRPRKQQDYASRLQSPPRSRKQQDHASHLQSPPRPRKQQDQQQGSVTGLQSPLRPRKQQGHQQDSGSDTHSPPRPRKYQDQRYSTVSDAHSPLRLRKQRQGTSSQLMDELSFSQRLIMQKKRSRHWQNLKDSSARTWKKVRLGLMLGVLSMIPFFGTFVFPAAGAFATFKALGRTQGFLVGICFLCLPPWLTAFIIRGLLGMRVLMRELMEPYFSRMGMTHKEKRRWFDSRRDILFGFSVIAYLLIQTIPIFNFLAYGVIQASASYMVLVTDPLPIPNNTKKAYPSIE